MRRTLLVAAVTVGFALPAPAAVIGFAPAANAASSATCSKLKGSAGGSVTVEHCSPVPAGKAGKAFKKLTAPNAGLLEAGGSLTWNGGATVTFGSPTLTTPPTNTCKSKTKKGVTTQDSAEDATGTVTTGDGAVALTGSTYTIDICIANKGGKLYLQPGTNIGL
jgi:hypothetical protein